MNSDFFRAEGGVVCGRAGKHDHLQPSNGREVEHALEGMDAIGVGVGEGVIEDDWQAAVVVGGTLLVGGRGTIVGTLLGVLLFTTLTNVFVQNNMSTSAQAVAKGVIIVAAVLLQQQFAAREKAHT